MKSHIIGIFGFEKAYQYMKKIRNNVLSNIIDKMVNNLHN